MSKYTDMVNYYNGRIDELQRDNQFWRNKCRSIECNQAKFESKIDTYKEILRKFLGEKCTTTDSIFIFEGKCFYPVEFTFYRDPDNRETLRVDFVKAPIQLGE